MKVLIAEDEPHILSGLVEVCRDEGYQICTAADGVQALQVFEQEKPDFILLDIMMPGVSGYDVCRRIRQSHQDIPIIFISAKSEEIDRVLGLELGADDFISKPFGIREVCARIRAVTRRCLTRRRASEPEESFKMSDLEVFPDRLRAVRGSEPIDLSLRDVKILEVLHYYRNQVVQRDTLFREVWGLDHLPNSRTLDQHISQLRKRIEVNPKDPRIILTVHGVGYRYDE